MTRSPKRRWRLPEKRMQKQISIHKNMPIAMKRAVTCDGSFFA
jgi:hypothetical protein